MFLKAGNLGEISSAIPGVTFQSHGLSNDWSGPGQQVVRHCSWLLDLLLFWSGNTVISRERSEGLNPMPSHMPGEERPH